MKTTRFGEKQAEPEDDITAMFTEIHGCSEGLEAEEDMFDNADHMGGWNVEVRNEDGDAITVRGFSALADLRDYLKAHRVEII